MLQLHIDNHPQTTPEDLGLIDDAINQHNMTLTGITDWWPIHLFLRDETNTIHGGLIGGIWAGCAEIKLFWIEESLRGQGFGSKMLVMAETLAREKGCHLIHLDTFSFQAPEFYKKHGFEVFGVIEDYLPGHSKYFMKKRL
jgi:GNAT superfamily N-acetyltransferase